MSKNGGESMKLEHLQVYLNQRVSIKDYPDFDVENQGQLVEILKTVSNKYYLKSFLKQFINTNECKGNEIEEYVYEMYCEPEIMGAVPKGPTETDEIIYSIKNQLIKIPETPRIIGGLGTTGLRTWEAALCLASRLEVGAATDFGVEGVVCELGTGTGLVGMSLLSSVEKVIFTDGDSNLLESLPNKIQLNQLGHNYDIRQLIWGPSQDPETTSQIPKVDYLVAADVTYDSSVLPDLVYTIKQFLQNGCKKCLLAATVRNESTLQQFETLLDKSVLQWTNLETFSPTEFMGINNSTVWYGPGTPPINIYSISI